MSIPVFIMWAVLTYGSSFFVNGGTEPRHLAVINGSRAVVKCPRDNINVNRSLWTFYSVDEPTRGIQIFNGHNVLYPYNGSYWVDQSSRGQFDLMKNVATLEDAGTYQCSRSLDTKCHAELIVLVSDPDCQLNQTITNDTVSLKDELQMWCTVEFRGNWSPSMQWEKSSGRVITTGVSSSIISRHQTQSNVTSNISTQILTSTLRLQPSSVEKDGIRFSCVTYFEKHSQRNILARPGSTPADKNPNYTHTWTSPVIYGEYESPLWYIVIGVSVIILGCIVTFAIACWKVKRKSKQNTKEDESTKSSSETGNDKRYSNLNDEVRISRIPEDMSYSTIDDVMGSSKVNEQSGRKKIQREKCPSGISRETWGSEFSETVYNEIPLSKSEYGCMRQETNNQVIENGKQKHVKVGKDGTVYQEVYYTKEAPSNRFSAVLYALVDKTKKKKKATNDEA